MAEKETVLLPLSRMPSSCFYCDCKKEIIIALVNPANSGAGSFSKITNVCIGNEDIDVSPYIEARSKPKECPLMVVKGDFYTPDPDVKTLLSAARKELSNALNKARQYDVESSGTLFGQFRVIMNSRRLLVKFVDVEYELKIDPSLTSEENIDRLIAFADGLPPVYRKD